MLNRELRQWIKENLERGVPRSALLTLMLEEGFPKEDSADAVNHAHSVIRESACRWQHEGPMIQHARFAQHQKGSNSVYELSEFLSADECERIVASVSDSLRPSTILGNQDPALIRTSRTSQIGSTGDELTEEIDRRIGETLKLPLSYSEPLQLHYYRRGEFFKDHTDYLPAEKIGVFDPAFGQRTFSVLIYLNTVDLGGETVFPKLGLSFPPQIGTALVWNNVSASLHTNSKMTHRAEPVGTDYKVVMTKWFRLPQKDCDHYFPREPRRPDGFSFYRGQFYAETTTALRLAFHQGRFQAEQGTEEYIKGSTDGSAPSHVVTIDDDLKCRTLDESFSRIFGGRSRPRNTGTLYGIRQYNPGAHLDMHFDRPDGAHDIGMILCVDQSVDEPWPLLIEDKTRRLHEIYLKPGDFLVYKASSLLHGRPKKLKSGYVRNVYAHFPNLSFN